MKKQQVFILLSLLFTSIVSPLFAQTHHETQMWLEAKIPLLLVKAEPFAGAGVTGGLVESEDAPQIHISEDCVMSIYKGSHKASGFAVHLAHLQTVEAIGATLILETTKGSVSFIGTHEDNPDVSRVIKTNQVRMEFMDDEHAQKVYHAILHLAKKCHAPLIAEGMFDKK